MKRVALVTDSTTDLTKELQAELGVHVIKLKVVFGGQVIPDGELSPVEFFLRLLQTKEVPTTLPPNLEDFVSLYKSLLESHNEIISIHLTKALSKTIDIAREARDILGAVNHIHLIDSGSVSMGTALLVSEAAMGIRQGMETKEILAALNVTQANTETMLMLDTLFFLRRNGRIGNLRGMVASFLNFKPLIRVNAQGEFDAVGKARDHNQALKTMVKLFQEKAAGRKVVSFGVVHGSAREVALRLKLALEYAFGVKGSFFTEVGPTIGVHSGPGLIGAALRFAPDKSSNH